MRVEAGEVELAGNEEEHGAHGCKAGVAAGFAFGSLEEAEYTLAPAARLDRIVAEVRRSVRWRGEHLAGYGADPNRLYVA